MPPENIEDKIFHGFLETQNAQAMALARDSDLLDLVPQGDPPYHCWLAHFSCKGLVREKDNTIKEAEDFLVGIYFPFDYLRRCRPMEVVTWLAPDNIFHPNVSDRAPLICLGHMTAGTGLVDLIYQVWEVITFRKVTMVESDALNTRACVWARHNQDRFPIDNRPLKRRCLDLAVHMGQKEETP